MRKLIIIAAMLSATAAFGQEVASQSSFVPYSDALRACSASWRASDERKAVTKGNGQAAWNEYRAACVIEQGYVKGRKAAK